MQLAIERTSGLPKKQKKKEKEGTGGIFVDSFCSFTDRASSVMASMVVGLREGVLCWSERGVWAAVEGVVVVVSGLGLGLGLVAGSVWFGFGFGFGLSFSSFSFLLPFPPLLSSPPFLFLLPSPPLPSLPLSSPSSLPLQLLVPVSRCLTQRSGLTVTSTCLSSSHF